VIDRSDQLPRAIDPRNHCPTCTGTSERNELPVAIKKTLRARGGPTTNDVLFLIVRRTHNHPIIVNPKGARVRGARRAKSLCARRGPNEAAAPGTI